MIILISISLPMRNIMSSVSRACFRSLKVVTEPPNGLKLNLRSTYHKIPPNSVSQSTSHGKRTYPKIPPHFTSHQIPSDQNDAEFVFLPPNTFIIIIVTNWVKSRLDYHKIMPLLTCTVKPSNTGCQGTNLFHLSLEDFRYSWVQFSGVYLS